MTEAGEGPAQFYFPPPSSRQSIGVDQMSAHTWPMFSLLGGRPDVRPHFANFLHFYEVDQMAEFYTARLAPPSTWLTRCLLLTLYIYIKNKIK